MKPVKPKSSVAASVAAAIPQAAPAAPIPAANPPIYGQTHYDAGATYPGTDPVIPPVNDGGKIKLGTSDLPDMDFIRALSAENIAVTGNPNFLEVTPTVEEMDAIITQLQEQVTTVTTLKRQWMESTNVKDATRGLAETMFGNRAAYVQIASNGNSALILNAGFELRKTRTPIGVLPPPNGLRVDLNGTIGKMITTWTGVPKAKIYLLQWAEQNDQPPVWHAMNGVGKPTLTLEGMTVGVTYLFRVAAVATTGTQSDWSPVVSRTAA